jgi:hypothetical protein
MKESLTFPYSYGMEFIVKLMQKSGKEKAFAGVLQNPPHTTRQVMEPETYLSGERLEPMRVPDFKHDFRDYQKFDIGAMGEFDVAVLIEQYAGKPLSKKLYPEWRGGYYYAAKTKPDPKSELKSESKSDSKPEWKSDPTADSAATAALGLLYVSRWSSADKAAEFAAIYAHSLQQRYKKAEEVGVPDPVTPEPVAGQNAKSDDDMLHGRHTWTTEDGPVIIEEQGDTVLVSESLNAATTEMLEKEVFAAPPAPK